MEGMVKLGEKLSNLNFKIGIPKYNLPRKSDNLMKPENSVILGMTKFYALEQDKEFTFNQSKGCLLYTSPSPRDMRRSRMPSSA